MTKENRIYLSKNSKGIFIPANITSQEIRLKSKLLLYVLSTLKDKKSKSFHYDVAKITKYTSLTRKEINKALDELIESKLIKRVDNEIYILEIKKIRNTPAIGCNRAICSINRLNIIEKFVLGRIIFMCSKDEFRTCYETDKNIASAVGVSPSTIKRIIRKFKYIEYISTKMWYTPDIKRCRSIQVVEDTILKDCDLSINHDEEKEAERKKLSYDIKEEFKNQYEELLNKPYIVINEGFENKVAKEYAEQIVEQKHKPEWYNYKDHIRIFLTTKDYFVFNNENFKYTLPKLKQFLPTVVSLLRDEIKDSENISENIEDRIAN